MLQNKTLKSKMTSHTKQTDKLETQVMHCLFFAIKIVTEDSQFNIPDQLFQNITQFDF